MLLGMASIPTKLSTGGLKVDGRSTVAKRAKRHAHTFFKQLGGADAVDPIVAARVRRAAELVAVAELTRAGAMRGEANLNDLIRVERLAEIAIRRLGLYGGRRQPEGLGLRDYLAAAE
jgi:hypothetical protein